jgi:simple sugar transport system ATP-binding protein
VVLPSIDKSDRETSAIDLRGVSKYFPGVVANEDISLVIRSGEIHALLGENGAGKSTLISVLAGLHQPDKGLIFVDGVQRRLPTPRDSLLAGIGTVFQHVLLAPTMSVIENLMLGGSWRKSLDRESALSRFRELCDLLAVKIDGNSLIASLSLGQRQQVEIMRALWRGGERVLILDEPTSMLTPQGVIELSEVIRRLRDNGVAIVFVTHKLREAYDLCDRISILRNGHLVGQIEPDDRERLGENGTISEIVRLMFEKKMDIEIGISGDSGQDRSREEKALSATELKVTPLVVRDVSTTDAVGECPLRKVSFEVEKGKIFGIAGIDGNGQKHLAEVLSGQRVISHGRIELNHESISELGVYQRRTRGIRYLTDDRVGEGIVSVHPVATNLVMKRIGEEPYWKFGLTLWAKIFEFARAQIRTFDIRTPSERTPIGRLSGGNIQKVLFAREISENPQMIVFNKPTYGLDLQNIQFARDRIREGAENGVTTVLISTELDELIELASQIGVMYQGRMVGIVKAEPGAENHIGSLMTGATSL